MAAQQPVPNSESECTFALADEDHTLGNAIRYALNRHADVVFAGYSVPHPSEPVVNVRVQTSGRITATQALRDALTGAQPPSARCARLHPLTRRAADLTAQCEHISACFETAVAKKRAEQGEAEAMQS